MLRRLVFAVFVLPILAVGLFLSDSAAYRPLSDKEARQVVGATGTDTAKYKLSLSPTYIINPDNGTEKLNLSFDIAQTDMPKLELSLNGEWKFQDGRLLGSTQRFVLGYSVSVQEWDVRFTPGIKVTDFHDATWDVGVSFERKFQGGAWSAIGGPTVKIDLKAVGTEFQSGLTFTWKW